MPGTGSIVVDTVDFGFRPTEIRITAGNPVNIILANRGAIVHDLTVPALRFQLAAQPGQLREAALRAAPPGTYEFYCSVPGHRQAGMNGRVVVSPWTGENHQAVRSVDLHRKRHIINRAVSGTATYPVPVSLCYPDTEPLRLRDARARSEYAVTRE